jgi:hypothetical protein
MDMWIDGLMEYLECELATKASLALFFWICSLAMGCPVLPGTL